MSFLPTSKPVLPQATDLIAAAASAAGVDPKHLATANKLIDIAKQLQAGEGGEALASIGAELLAQARPELAKALELMQKASDLAAATPGCFPGALLADHALHGLAPTPKNRACYVSTLR